MNRLVPAVLFFMAVVLLLLGPAKAAEQPGSVLIWPVNPVLAGEDRATALWLENPGQAPITLQIGIYAWAQAEGKSVYAPQDEVIGTPPIVTIPPGAKQLIRLTRIDAPPAEIERPYRIIVDEIPAQTPAGTAKVPGAAVSFRMRYSLPLFSYAKGGSPEAAEAAKKPAPSPSLAWRVASDADGRFIEMRNDGPVHARLTQAAFINGANRTAISAGLLGYVPSWQHRPLAASRRNRAQGRSSCVGERRTRRSACTASAMTLSECLLLPNRRCKTTSLAMATLFALSASLTATSTAAAMTANKAGSYGSLPPPPTYVDRPGEQRLELELVVNGLSADFVAPVMVSGGRYQLRLADLKRAGILIDAPQDRLFLDDMPGVSAVYDQSAQRLLVSVPSSYLPRQRLGNRKADFQPASYDMGGLINYDVYVSGGVGTRTQASLHHEARFFGAAGTVSTTGVVRTGPGKRYIRYDTRFRRSDEASATTIEVGDFITRSLPWASAVRMGGIQFSRDFAVRPDIITYPLPQFAGNAALPSTVELVVDNQRVAGGAVNPGPFALENLPPINGAGEANLIVTDMHGRSIQAALPFYVSSDLLAPGLTDYAVAFGAFRENYGVKNFDYGGVAMSASLRHGLTPGITLEVRGEIAGDMRLAGGGAVVKLGNGGVLSGSYSRSFRNGAEGGQLTFGYEYQARLFSVALRHSRQTAGYVDLGLVDAFHGNFARTVSSATLSLSMGRYGTLGLGYFDIRRDGWDDARFANASWSLPFLGASRVNASATREFEDRTWSGALTISLPLGGRAGNLSAGVIDAPGSPRSWRADYARAIPTEGGLGWSAGAIANENGDTAWRGDVAWRTDPVEIRAGAYGERDAILWAGASGALVVMDGALFAANRVADAFVVVSTDGAGDIPVRYENQLIGRTNAHGKLLIPWASAYYPGTYAIDPLGLPANVKVPTISQTVAIAAGSGAIVRFPVERMAAARATLTDAHGAPIAAGVPVRINDVGVTYVGWDGLLFIEQAKAENRLVAERPDGSRCSARFAVRETSEDIIDLGELPCRAAND